MMARHWFTTYLTDFYSKNKKIGLDIGCGKQPYKEIYNCHYTGIDIPSIQMNDAKNKPNFFAIGENLPFKDKTFDFISCYSVIPYVENINKFLNELYRVSKNDCIAVITIMNLRSLSQDPDTNYPNKFSSKELTKKLEEHGFKSIKYKNPKTLFWSTYFNSTSVYSYAIVKCCKNNIKQVKVKSKSTLTNRQKLRSKVIKSAQFYKFSKNFYRKYCKTTQSFHTLPDFLIIGAAKCGTSSLYDYLMKHPCVGRSLTKQIHFFDRYFDREISWYKVCFPFIWEKFWIEKIRGKKFVTGEATAHYMTHPLAAERCHKILPNVKIIVMLRNPIDRAYSHYQMEKSHRKEDLSFEDAIEKEPQRIHGEFEEMQNNKNNFGRNYPHRAYVKSGEYLDQIKIWEKFYPKENFMFIKSEDFNKDSSSVYNQVLNFLGLEAFELEIYEKIRKRQYEKMDSQTREALSEFFKPYNEKLYRHIGINFNWDE
jgi:ubiquinone/menaquinone biosynthesis C-methylase UbiE